MSRKGQAKTKKMEKTKSLILAMVATVLMASGNAALAAIGSSASYSLDVADLTNAGSAASSGSYESLVIVGDSFDGESSSASYTLCAGFAEETGGGCIAAVPPPPPPPGGGGGAGGRPPDYWPPGDDEPVPTQETQIPPETQETGETEETQETGETNETAETAETAETQPGEEPGAPDEQFPATETGPGGAGIEEGPLSCDVTACYALPYTGLRAAAEEREDAMCFIVANIFHVLIVLYFIWLIVSLSLMPPSRGRKG